MVVDSSDSNNTKKVLSSNKNDKVGVYGYITTPAATSCINTGTYYTLAGTFSNPIQEGFSIIGDKLTYTGTNDIYVEIQYSGSFTSSKNNANITVGIEVNGTLIDGSDMDRTLSIGDVGSWASTCATQISNGDEIVIVAKSNVANTDVTATKFNTTLQKLW